MISKIYARDVIAAMEQIAPSGLALPKDKIGLQLGNVDKPVSRVWVALEASPETVAAAVQAGVDMLVTHHALLYHPISQLDTRRRRDRAIQQLLAADITVFSAHTNLDVAEGGVNDVMAERLGLTQVEILDVTGADALYKLVVYVPQTHLAEVRQALGDAGAGAIGHYSHCTFHTVGVGQFLPGANTTPFLGQSGKLESVAEARLETVVPEPLLSSVLAAMQTAHPYEEIAYDLLPLRQKGKRHGIGRVGNLPRAMTLKQFAHHVRQQFSMQHIRYVGDDEWKVHRVAVLGGSGSGWVGASLAKGAQVLVTADVGHHDACDAWQDGLAIVDGTHAALEQPVCAVVAERLKRMLGLQTGGSVEIVASPIDVDPFSWV